MNALVKQCLNAILHTVRHRRRLRTFIIVILSVTLLAWVGQQLFTDVTGELRLSPELSVTVIKPAGYERTPAESSYKRRLFIRLPGASARLGNRMFGHAALLGLAADSGLQATVSFAHNNNILSSIFRLTTPVAGLRDARLVHQRTVEWPWRTAVYVPPPMNLMDGVAEDDDIVLVGYFQSWRYFHAVEGRVRAEFRFRKHVADAAADVLRQLTAKYTSSSTNLVLIGIHVRRNDMALDYNLRRGYTVADEHYLRRAMNYVADRVATDANGTATSLLFVVCTDDEEWTRYNLNATSYPVAFASRPHGTYRKAEVDLAVLASCDHVITTVGTFGWWAGYLHRPDGITVYYTGFPKPGTEIGNNFHAEDFFPPSWIGIL